MEGGTAKKSISLEKLVIENLSNVSELKGKLNDIIQLGQNYEYDVSISLQSLLTNNDPEIVCLTVQAIAELSKCETKRLTYANSDIIQVILEFLRKEITNDSVMLLKQSCRALGNMCCECDEGRKAISSVKGLDTFKSFLESITKDHSINLEEIKILLCKTVLNFTIGGAEMSQAVINSGIIDLLQNILAKEVKKNVMNDDLVQTVLLVLSAVNDNIPDHLYSSEINVLVLGVLRETSNIDISELCLEHLHMQAEHDSVKTLLANEGGVQLVCSRLELLLWRRARAEMEYVDEEAEPIMKQACDLIIIILTGDEAMDLLYNNGMGEVYLTMVKWLDSTDYNLLTTAVLAIGNFARQDTYCIQMMEDKIFDKLLDIFEVYHGFTISMQREPTNPSPIDVNTVRRVQLAVVSALRNLVVAPQNKRTAAAGGRAMPLALKALPSVEDHHIAYKLLALIRMLVDGQESVARQLATNRAALQAVCRWGGAAECGAGGEPPRLLAWTVKLLTHTRDWTHIVQVEGCLSCLVRMLVSQHSVMQNEAILALTLLALQTLNSSPPGNAEVDYEKTFIAQILDSEVGKHISVLIDTNCAKLPVEVSENLLAFLDITCKKSNVAANYKETGVDDALRKFVDARTDLSDDLKTCIADVISLISNNETLG